MPNNHDLQLAARLVGTPEWDALWRIWDEMQDRHWAQLARDFATKDRRLDYETLQWDRGYSACGSRLRRVPAEAASAIKNTDTEEGDGE